MKLAFWIFVGSMVSCAAFGEQVTTFHEVSAGAADQEVTGSSAVVSASAGANIKNQKRYGPEHNEKKGDVASVTVTGTVLAGSTKADSVLTRTNVEFKMSGGNFSVSKDPNGHAEETSNLLVLKIRDRHDEAMGLDGTSASLGGEISSVFGKGDFNRTAIEGPVAAGESRLRSFLFGEAGWVSLGGRMHFLGLVKFGREFALCDNLDSKGSHVFCANLDWSLGLGTQFTYYGGVGATYKYKIDEDVGGGKKYLFVAPKIELNGASDYITGESSHVGTGMLNVGISVQ